MGENIALYCTFAFCVIIVSVLISVVFGNILRKQFSETELQDEIRPETIFLNFIPYCEWKEDLYGNWLTVCGHKEIFSVHSPMQAEYIYCPFCGKRIREIPFKINNERVI